MFGWWKLFCHLMYLFCMRKYFSSPNLSKINKWQKNSSQKKSDCVRKVISSPNLIIFYENLFRHLNFLKRIGDEIFFPQKVSIWVKKVILSPNRFIMREETCFVTKFIWNHYVIKKSITKEKWLDEKSYFVTQFNIL